MTGMTLPAEGHAFLIVRAVVTEPSIRGDFDHWYRTDHAPLASRLLGAGRYWRFWSLTEDGVHYAVYAFADEAALRAAMASPDVPRLLGEFDGAWPAHVTRTREWILQVAP